MLKTHLFGSNQVHIASVKDTHAPNVSIINKGTATKAPLETLIQVTNNISEYPYPIKLEEGVIVQDTDQVPFEGKWRPAKEAQAMKAEREKAAKS